MEFKRVVVTGLGALTPVGNSVSETWESLLQGKSGAGPITLFDASHFKTQFACEVKGFNPNDHFDRKEARRYDRYTQFALVTAKEALEDSGLDLEKTDLERVGVIISAGIGGLETFEQEVMDYSPEKGPRFNPFFIPKMISDIAAGLVSIQYGFNGPNYSVASACASSTNAIIDAAIMIRLGKADVMVAGGSEAAVTIAGIGGFNAMNALSTRNDSPETASRPFSKSRDGFVLGEGSSILILEELEHALARGAKIYAEFGGFGLSADAHHLTASHPEGLGAKLVMQRTLEDANLKPGDVDYINVHGTSTPVGDISEVKAITAVFGDEAKKLNISSTKSMTGHLLGATGALEALVAVKSVCEDVVPPTINHQPDDEDPEFPALNYTFDKPCHRTVRAAMSNTFGFGGHNACVLFKKYVGK
ncbi:beta-ketoacyl-ACP synthase II [Porphyromonas endodontalis]|jgi:beta-ketoacyl-acyl-carrier-protein synthase II|uniref:3-oxoacyl-[acyl-carrier-protein] synthase 2 n=1 Tax=Porphyromonas endodontalis (strain ATCC 35406 / DSM 24491 / JCM 8526 / CCUG 16442 / BCRC 14492 / NCTC 13058 / HG 370) TaxID=553175 RepID=C3J7U6_POREA|nr:beta-ketoacyl-ACP synthase II [Porphyromonas endodontalis]EEN83711.1 beta-ketoacyl-acyl-carrier-protein synthase II [Porphyromonas endodontalis ATCC 35406]MDC1542060.1 beta-ketoacyl-ACP synthase II [Candidatus Pseudothioglobus singularis]UBH65340.1 beta-ketoacyl-ACP synthase II [Porphyromonas endodontalis]SUB68041.1 3-oxoacyl-[acyl-carrier-protein] synthase 2 [Porphyromonas endodontalis]